MENRPKPTLMALTVADWHYPWWVDRQNLLWRLAGRGWPVVYGCGPLSVWDRNGLYWQRSNWFDSVEEVQGQGGAGEKVRVLRAGRAWATWPRFKVWSKLMEGRYARRFAALTSVPSEERIAMICWPSFLPYTTLLNANRVILHVNDVWTKLDGWNEKLDSQLLELVRRADLITCVAGSMAQMLPEDGPDRAKIVPHGVDYDAIIKGKESICPADLHSIPHPRIGYLGRISKKVDLELVAAVAAKRPLWHWVFVGSSAWGFGDDQHSWDALSRCKVLRNVHFIGRKDHHELPAYLAHMDVNVMCYKASDGYWSGGAPFKLFEYMATGKPIVSSNLENVRPYSHLIRIADSVDEWIQAIEQALIAPEEKTSAMLQTAKENTWEERADRYHCWLLEMLGWMGDEGSD